MIHYAKTAHLLQRFWQKIANSGDIVGVDLSDLGVQLIAHNPYDDYESLSEVIQKANVLGIHEMEINISEDEYGHAIVKKNGKCEKYPALRWFLTQISDTCIDRILVQFVEKPSNRLLDDIKSAVSLFDVEVVVGSLHLDILNNVAERWPEIKKFRLNGTPFARKVAKEKLAEMTGGNVTASISYTFWKNVAGGLIIGPMHNTIRRYGIDAQIAAKPKKVAGTVAKYCNGLSDEERSKVAVYVMI